MEKKILKQQDKKKEQKDASVEDLSLIASSTTQSRRKSRELNLSANISSSTPPQASPIRKRKHWRSPSNPIDFAMNCSAFQWDPKRSSFPSKNNNITHVLMLKNAVQETAGTTPERKDPKTSLSPFIGKNRISQLRFLARFEEGTEEFEKMTLNTSTTTNNNNNSLAITCTNINNRTQKSPLALNSYEILLARSPQSFTPFPMLAELSISPIVATGSSDFSSTKRHTFAFESAYCGSGSAVVAGGVRDLFAATSLAHGRIDPLESEGIFSKYSHMTATSKRSSSPGNPGVIFSRSSLVQVILRNPQDGIVAGIFVIKLDLSDMPPESRTILRQKAYKSKQQSTDQIQVGSEDYLAKYIEIPLKRCYDSAANRQRIRLAGPIRLGFSFNRSNLRYTSARRTDTSEVEPVQKTRTLLQFPSTSRKYFPLVEGKTDDNPTDPNASKVPSSKFTRANSLTTENNTRSFQHGSLL